MQFGPQTQLSSQINGIGILVTGSPAAVAFGGSLYLFYGFPPADVRYASYNGATWSNLASVHVATPTFNIAAGTNPYPIVYNGTLYLFYCGSGNNGVFYVTFDGTSWSPAQLIPGSSFQPGTSPSAVVVGTELYVFWRQNSAMDVSYSTSYGGESWENIVSVTQQVNGMGLAPATSPAVISWGGPIYVFYNGVGNNGTFYTAYTGSSWSRVGSVAAQIGGMGFLPGTSPAACVLADGKTLALFWNGSGDNGIWHTTSSGGTWADQQPVVCYETAAGILAGTSPCATLFGPSLALFWNGSGDDGLWASGQVPFATVSV